MSSKAKSNSNLVNQTEHFVYGTSDGGTYAQQGYQVKPWSGASAAANSRLGGITGSRLLPDGQGSIAAVLGTNNPGGSFMTIYVIGGSSIGNSGFTRITWSNEDGTETGSAERASLGYASITPSTTNKWSRRWTISAPFNADPNFTGTHPKTIIDDGYIKLTFVR